MESFFLISSILAGAFAAVFITTQFITNLPSIVEPPPRSAASELDKTILGIPATTFGGFKIEQIVERMPKFIWNWCRAESQVAVGVLLFVIFTIARRESLKKAMLWSVYPCIIFVALGTTYIEPRYSMSVLPFWSVLAAAGFVMIPLLWLRIIMISIAVAIPALLSYRYDNLIGRQDTRFVLRTMLHPLAETRTRASIDSSVLIKSSPLPKPLQKFPMNGDYSIWPPIGKSCPHDTFAQLQPDLFIRRSNPGWYAGNPPEMPDKLNYILFAKIEGGAAGNGVLPDAPDHIIPDLLYVERSGPTIEFWARKPSVIKKVECLNLEGLTITLGHFK
ncbi:MAG: hypothetical protein ACKVS6_03940 [Planctomycetota bacterium]